MDILVVHPSLNEGGGSEKVALSIIKSLKERGHNVALAAFEKTNWKKVTKFFGQNCEADIEFTYPRIFGMSAYGELLNFHLLLSRIPRKYKTVITSTSSPWFYCPQAEKSIVYFNCSPVNYKYGLKRAYLLPYNYIQHKLLKKAKKTILLTNSTFSAEAIKNVYLLDATVIYPPVDIEVFRPSSQKEDLIVTLGRFNPSKKHETLIRAFSMVKRGRCIIIGSVRKRDSIKYLKKLKQLVNDLKINRKVDLIVNCSFSMVRNILSKAKIYVHCAPFEYFGVSVVEAMASGCVPIVYRGGGPYTDIIEYNKYGISFKDPHELARKINSLLDDDNLYKKLAEKAIRRSKIFSANNFKNKIVEIVEL